MDIRTILIIDDEIEVCLLLHKHLTKKNKNVAFATNLKDGIEKFEKMKPDLLILDNNLSKNSCGIANIPTFKSINYSSTIIIISAMHNLKKEALTMGADYFLEKPISFQTFQSIL
ncbi:MAG: response regulator [Bacteroidota bacterium]